MLRSMWIIYFLIALSLEWFSFQDIGMQKHHFFSLVSFFSLHLVASFMFSLAQRDFIPKIYHDERTKIVWFLTFINFFVPVLGVVFSWLLVLWGFKVATRDKKRRDLMMLDPENISDGFPVTKRIFGEGSLLSILKNKYIPASTKVKVLFMLDQIKSSAAMDMIRSTLSDPNDEVRLVGFSIMDNNQKAMNFKINELLAMQKKSKTAMQKAEISKDLAYSYWEMIYQGLVDDQLALHIEKEALLALENALLYFEDDAELYKLRGKIYFRAQEYSVAKESFVKALDLGIVQSKVASFMAEISFVEKNYSRVSYWMNKIPKYELDYQLLNISALWRGKAA